MVWCVKLLLVAAAAGPTLAAQPLSPSLDVARERGPEIFNAIQNSMRQWGSSLHHNGMSLFLATVPEGVLLHHGNSRKESPTEPDWLAFEIEHAEGFARPRRRPPADRDPKDGPRPGGSSGGQAVLATDEPEQLGWLHVYRTTKELKLLYVDGMGAGKTDMGTLDTQDIILRGLSPSRDDGDEPPDGRRPGGGPMDERQRAADLCELCSAWGLQGVIRMEAGFEIIKCDFSDGLEEVQAMPRSEHRNEEPPPGGPGQPKGPPGSFSQTHFEFIRGVSERYDGIGSSRVRIDYASMVSALFYPVNLTNPDAKRPDLPRLTQLSIEDRDSIMDTLNSTVESRMDATLRGIDWQDVTGLIVARYADRIKFMVDEFDSTELLKQELETLLRLYIDDTVQDEDKYSKAIERCTDFYISSITPETESDRLIRAALAATTKRICGNLFRIFEHLQRDDGSLASTESSRSVLEGLMDYLRWPRFKRCAGCSVGEVCMIPMWPFGTVDEYVSPRCKNGSEAGSGTRYWDDFRRGPPRDGDGDKTKLVGLDSFV